MLFIGSTKKEVGLTPSVSAGGMHHVLDIALRLFPSLAECPFQRTWAGLRPKAAHSRPLLGPAPQWENVLIASGHSGFGILLSAITGELMAELIATGQVPSLMRPFVP